MISPQQEKRDGQSLIIYANLSRSRIPTHLTPAKIPKLLHAPMSKYFSFPKQMFTFHSRDRAHLLNKGLITCLTASNQRVRKRSTACFNTEARKERNPKILANGRNDNIFEGHKKAP